MSLNNKDIVSIIAFGVAFFFFSFLSFANSQVFIVVNPGPFKAPEAAALAEENVNWWDGDLTDDNACTESFAAVELKHFLQKCTDLKEADIVLVPPGNAMPEDGNIFLLGTSQSNPLIGKIGNEKKDAAPFESPESFRIRSSRQDNRLVCVIEGSDRVGCLYGVYDYLERMGMRFFGLGEQGTVYPDTPAQLIDRLNIQERPAYRSRGFWAWEDRGDETFLMWMARNRLNYWTAAQSNPHFCKKIGLNLVIGGHEPTKLFMDPDAEYPYNHPVFQGDEDKPEDPYSPPPGDEYRGDENADGKLTVFEAHPEWYGLLDGKRQGEIATDFGKCNFCTSNRDAIHFLAKNFVDSLIGGKYQYADIVNFWALDIAPWCACSDCKSLGSPTDRLLLLIHQVNEFVQQARRQGRLARPVVLHTCAYIETLQPPQRSLPEDFDYDNIAVTLFPIARSYTHPLGDPAATETNRSQSEPFLAWTHSENYKGSVCVGEYYNVSRIHTFPVVYSRIMAADIPWYYRHGARDFQYMHTPTRLWGTWTLNQRLMARLLWNPDLDTDELLKDYFAKFYPTTSESTRAFYEHLERATSNIKAVKHNIATPLLKEKHYSLCGRINALAEDLFSAKILRYEEYRPVTDDGIDWLQILNEMRLARKTFDSSLLRCESGIERKRLLEDEERFAYGETTFEFYDCMIRCLMFHHKGQDDVAAREFENAEKAAGKLRTMVDIIRGAGAHASYAENAFEATWVTEAYQSLKDRYQGWK